MSLVQLVLIVNILFHVTRAVPDVESLDRRTLPFIEAFSQVTCASSSTADVSIDPLYINYFRGSFATIHYQNFNSTVTGLKNCAADDFIISADGRVINFALSCPEYNLYSANEVHGYLLYKSMYGRGTLRIDYDKYVVRVYATLKYLTDALGYRHYQIDRFSLDVVVGGPISYKFMHLYNDNKRRSEEISELANKNWKTVAMFSRDPVWYPIMGEIVGIVNRYLLTVSI